MYNTNREKVGAGENVEKNVTNYMMMHEMIQPGDHVVVGVSGGPDSMALLDLLWKLQKRVGFALTAAHVHHGLREVDADLDQELVASYCKGRSIPFACTQVDVEAWAKERGLGIEEAGREVRYDYFRSLMKNGCPSKIATGHHLDDQVETVLMRILRGTGMKGLQGMEPVRKDGVIRPLLCAWKSEIMEYCKIHAIPYRMDATNYQEMYHRNRLRLQLIPALKSYNPAIEQALARLAEQANENEAYLAGQTEQAMERCMAQEEIVLERFSKEERLIQKRLLLGAVETAIGRSSLENRHFQMVMDKIEDEESTVWQLDLPGGIRFCRSYDRLLVEKKKDFQETDYFEYPLLPGKAYGFPRLGIVVESLVEEGENIFEKCQKPNEYCLDYDRMEKIGGKLILRQRRPGDRMLDKNADPGKKVKKIFIDKKVPAKQRDRAACFALGDGIVWIPGIARSDSIPVTGNTRRVLRVRIRNIQEETND